MTIGGQSSRCIVRMSSALSRAFLVVIVPANESVVPTNGGHFINTVTIASSY